MRGTTSIRQKFHEPSMHRRRLRMQDIGPVLKLLTPDDCRLLELLCGRGLTVREVGHMLGLNAATIVRQAARVRSTMAHPICRALLHRGAYLDPQLRDIAKRYFLHRQNCLSIARALNLSLTDVRRRVAWTSGWARGVLTSLARDSATTEHDADIDTHSDAD
jgi:hypothetical protein